MKPLSEKELRQEVTKLLWGGRTDVEGVVNLILQDRKAWGEYVIGEDQKYMTRQFPQSEKFLKNAAIRIENELRAEQRQRNQGEKTDE